MTKKVIFFIVEGPTDKNTFNPILKKIFPDQKICFHVVRGDLTTEKAFSAKTTVTRLKNLIDLEIGKSGYLSTDILEFVHLIDTDGAFIPSENVLYCDNERIEYSTNYIKTRDIESIHGRNENKSGNVKWLSELKKIKKKPYHIYYFSRNLEHFLHSRIDDMSGEEKMNLADDFVDKYISNIDGFKEFISMVNLSLLSSYEESWKYIFKDVNSLNRVSNFYLFFKSKNKL